MGIAAVGTVGIQNRHRIGQILLTFVVVGDDQVDSQLFAQPGLLQGGDTAVHRHDQPYTGLMQLTDGDLIQAVALLQSAGDVGNTIRFLLPQQVGQQTGGGDAVHVIVAENGDLLPLFQSLTKPQDSLCHICHQVGIMESPVTRKICLSRLRCF